MNMVAFSQAASCACLPGSILPHCSKAVNTFAAACQPTVKYCLCSVGPISRQLNTARTELLVPGLHTWNTAKQIDSVSYNTVGCFCKLTGCENTLASPHQMLIFY